MFESEWAWFLSENCLFGCLSILQLWRQLYHFWLVRFISCFWDYHGLQCTIQVAWTKTSIPQQIKEYFIFYKPVREENQQIRNGWSFKRSTQPSTTLAPLQPATGYVVSVLGYTSSRTVYGSNDVTFQTIGGNVTLTCKYSRLLSASAARDVSLGAVRPISLS